MKISEGTAKHVMIAAKPSSDKWDSTRRKTYGDPVIAKDGKIMYRKLKRILTEHGENVSVSNDLIVDIINAYIAQGNELRRLRNLSS